MNDYDRKILTKLGEEQARQGEGIRNIWRVTEKMEQHQETSNGTVLDLVGKVASNSTSNKRLWGIVGTLFTAVVAIAGRLLGVY